MPAFYFYRLTCQNNNLFLSNYSHPKMSCRNRTITIRPPWANTSCACRLHCSASTYQTGSDNTIRIHHARRRVIRPPTNRAISHANAPQNPVVGRDSTRRPHRSVRWAHKGPIAAHYCSVLRRIVITADRRRNSMEPPALVFMPQQLAAVVQAHSRAGLHRIWIRHKHHRAYRNVAPSHVAVPSTPVSYRWLADKVVW